MVGVWVCESVRVVYCWFVNVFEVIDDVSEGKVSSRGVECVWLFVGR